MTWDIEYIAKIKILLPYLSMHNFQQKILLVLHISITI